MNTVWKRRMLWICHGIILAGVLLFPFYRYAVDSLPPLLTGCVIHDRLFLYCPVCGGTRAVEALLRLDLLDALRLNTFVTLAILTAVALDVMAWIRYAQKKMPLFCIRPWFWVVMAGGLVVYTVVRNLLMVVWGIDPTGDLGFFWRMIRS